MVKEFKGVRAINWNRSSYSQISVVGGTGEVLIPTTSRSVLSKVCIQVPNHSTAISYSVDITDSDGFGITGKTNLFGDNTFDDNSICTGPLTLTISSASSDGLYPVKIYFYENLMG